MKKEESYRVSIIDSFDKWKTMSKLWNDLLSQSRSNTIFLSWEWLNTWVEHFLYDNRQLFVLAIYDGDNLIGLAPWYLNHTTMCGLSVKRIEFLGTPECGSDYLDVAARKRREKDVAQAIYRFLFKDIPASWDTALLRDISSDSLFLLYFLERLERDGKHMELAPGSFCPFMALPRDTDSFLRELSQHRRQQYSRASRELEKEGEVVQRAISSGEGLAPLSEFHTLYRQRWQKSETEVRFMEAFVARYFDRGLCEINLLAINNKNYAATLQLRHDKTVSLYSVVADRSFTNKISIGNYLVGQCMENAIRGGYSIYDFLKGSEEYKFYWANGGRRSLHLIFHRNRLAPAASVAFRGLKSAIKVLSR